MAHNRQGPITMWEDPIEKVLGLGWRLDMGACEIRTDWKKVTRDRAGEIGTQWELNWLLSGAEAP